MRLTDVVPVATPPLGSRPRPPWATGLARSVLGAAYDAEYSTPGMLWNEAPICTSIFGTVYDPRNFTWGNQFCSIWHDASEEVPSISTRALLPAFAGSWTSQKSVV